MIYWYGKGNTFLVIIKTFFENIYNFLGNTMNQTVSPAEIVGKKISNYFAEKGISQIQAGEMLGISQGAVSARLRGIKPFGNNAAKKWNEVFGFRINWLRTGEGPMFDKDSNIVQNNTSGGDMYINTTVSQNTGDDTQSRVLKTLLEEAQQKIVDLQTKVYKLMDKLTENGIDCDC